MKNLIYKNLYVIVTQHGFPDWTTLSYGKPEAIEKFIESGKELANHSGQTSNRSKWNYYRSKYGYQCVKVDVSVYPADGRECKDDAKKRVGLCGK